VGRIALPFFCKISFLFLILIYKTGTFCFSKASNTLEFDKPQNSVLAQSNPTHFYDSPPPCRS